MIFTKTPIWAKRIMPQAIWKIPGEDQIFLTFDDGPSPGVTDWVLDLLDQYDAKATFFCIGKKVQESPQLFQEIIDRGHAIGNHSQTHPNGWKCKTEKYLADVKEAANVIPSILFRPPYGKLKPQQYNSLKEDYQIIMWDVLSWDFKQNLSPEECLEGVLQHTSEGSIIVYHDAPRTFEKLQHNLPILLKHFSEKGFRFSKILSAKHIQKKKN